jgi:two-component system, NtrC family, response regulator HydG
VTVRAIVLDEGFRVADRARVVLPSADIRVDHVRSLTALAAALAAHPTDGLLVANVPDTDAGWALWQHIRQARFGGRTLVLLQEPALSISEDFEEVPWTECQPLPLSTAHLDQALLTFALTAISLGSRAARPGEGVEAVHGMVGRSAALRAILTRVEKVAAGDANVCIYGESGSGKELIARAIHERSERRHGPFVVLDCTAIPEGLMESHLFGHVRGAFTGAIDHRDGMFALADQGTLFIDELGELSLPLQAKLLRVLQTREFFRVGSARPIRSDVRIVTATNKDLARAVQHGMFREDLYYRVAVVMIRVPPLRERRADIPLLVNHFVGVHAALHQKSVLGVHPAAMARLVALSWPGNVRQLSNFVEQAVVMTDHSVLTERDLFSDEDAAAVGGDGTTLDPVESRLTLDEVERRHIAHVLQMVGGNRTKAARLLRISVRGLQYKLKSYGQQAGAGALLSQQP